MDYKVGDSVQHQIVCRSAGNLTDADSVNYVLRNNSGYQIGSGSATKTSLGTYRINFYAPSLVEGDTFVTEVTATVTAYPQTILFKGRIADPDEVSLNTTEIADEILSRGVTEAIASAGTIDRNSLGAVVLMMTSAATGTDGSGGSHIQLKHPDTDVVLHTFQVDVGPGCPVQEIS